MSNASYVLVYLYCVHGCLRICCHQQSWETAVPSKFEDSLGIESLKGFLYYFSLVLPHIHHPEGLAESIDSVDNGWWIFLWGILQHIFQELYLLILYLLLLAFIVPFVVSKEFTALLVRHINYYRKYSLRYDNICLATDHFGLMSKSKMLVGMETVQHALGTSTMLLILPSIGAQLNSI